MSWHGDRLIKEGFHDLRRRLPDLDRAYRRQRIARWAGRGFLVFAMLAAGAGVLRSMGVWPLPGDKGHAPHVNVSESETAQAQPSSQPSVMMFGGEVRPDAPSRVEAR